MRLKLDENLPREICAILVQFGHDLDTVSDEGLTGRDDQTVWSACVQAQRFFLTQDLDFSDIRRYAPGTHQGLMLVRLDNPSRSALLKRIRQIFETEEVTRWQGCLVVASEHKIRVRRP